ncbi:MAG: beta-ketoacyl synthase N-terminal-like domain-containing protein [Verrucomicrobiales bacterium]
MSRIVVVGSGAVSPAGWGKDCLMKFLESGDSIAFSEIERQNSDGEVVATRVAKVPPLEDRRRLPRSPRLRRSSALGKYAAAAMLEALGTERYEAARKGDVRVSVICTLMNGCVNYSNRFFGEVLLDPSVASPILFPETVYNAPSSHLSAVMHSTAPNDTLVGDASEWFAGLELATEWLGREECDLCVVVATEEIDWLSAEAAGYYNTDILPAEGAAAVVLGREGGGPEVVSIPDPISYAEVPSRTEAMKRIWGRLGVVDDGKTLWADGRNGVARLDNSENFVWEGPRISVRQKLGDAMGASSGLQTVAALEWLQRGKVSRAVVTSAGGNEGAAGAVFKR